MHAQRNPKELDTASSRVCDPLPRLCLQGASAVPFVAGINSRFDGHGIYRGVVGMAGLGVEPRRRFRTKGF
jgi:hypothetical protein